MWRAVYRPLKRFEVARTASQKLDDFTETLGIKSSQPNPFKETSVMSHESQTMKHESQTARTLSLNPVALSCFAVAVCAFTTSLAGLAIGHFPAGGMALVGAFYLVIGAIDAVAHPGAVVVVATHPTTEHATTGVRQHSSLNVTHNMMDDRASALQDAANKTHDRRRDLVEA